jgi:hypothetical protein
MTFMPDPIDHVSHHHTALLLIPDHYSTTHFMLVAVDFWWYYCKTDQMGSAAVLLIEIQELNVFIYLIQNVWMCIIHN